MITSLPVEKETIILKPVSTVENIISTYQEYNRLKDRLLTDWDYQLIRWKKCIKKSWFRKLATAFSISTEITRENRVNLDDYFIYEITCRATSPTWRYAESCASCASNERDFTHLENDVRATAQTRATNRAISDLIWTWEISAEEIDESEVKKRSNTPKMDDIVTPHEEPSEVFESPLETTTSSPAPSDNEEPITTKQRHLLIRLIETRYQDEHERSSLFKRMNVLSKTEARFAIQRMLA